jgi:hypothetical protein
MRTGATNMRAVTDKQLARVFDSSSTHSADTKEELDRRLLVLLGEVIRMSQAWARALESGDPLTADKCEADCIFAMEKFEANRKKILAMSESLEKTR